MNSIPHSFSQYLDFANHHANSTPSEIRELCEKVIQYGFHAAFVNPAYIATAKTLLRGKAKVGTVVAFPLGQDSLSIKIAAAKDAINLGADELDVVPNLGTFISGDREGMTGEMQQIAQSAHALNNSVIVKFIIDPGYFDSLPDKNDRLTEAALCVRAAGADFVKLGSGMGPRGPNLADLKIVKTAVGDTIKIKVAGGIETYEQAYAFVSGGADRLGTSRAIEIIDAAPQGR